MAKFLTLQEAQRIYGHLGGGEFNFMCPTCGGIEFLLRLDLSRGCVISVCALSNSLPSDGLEAVLQRDTSRLHGK